MVTLEVPEDLGVMVTLEVPEDLGVMVTLEVLEDLGGMVILEHLEHQEVVIQTCGLEPVALDICIQMTDT